jgi:hypothetical protein
MSELEQLTAEIRRATDYQTNKRILREKIQTDLHLAHHSGLFKITPDLIAFLDSWPKDVETIYLEDTYGNPIEVDRKVLLVQAQQHYQKVMNTWHQQHEELKRIRKI